DERIADDRRTHDPMENVARGPIAIDCYAVASLEAEVDRHHARGLRAAVANAKGQPIRPVDVIDEGVDVLRIRRNRSWAEERVAVRVRLGGVPRLFSLDRTRDLVAVWAQELKLNRTCTARVSQADRGVRGSRARVARAPRRPVPRLGADPPGTNRDARLRR